jgi:hypothetical protein
VGVQGVRRTDEVLVEKIEGRRPLGRPRSRGNYDIKMDIQGVG